ncbi:GPR1/FUN34/yaaH family-domain-containing protein [Xylaria intraflava]|nr:GPR1/FUN34/yaaH family-domain-containing protein [Xylaria intraflava]
MASMEKTGANGDNDVTPVTPPYGGNPQYNLHTPGEARLAAFGGELQPGLYKPTEHRKFANPGPLGLSAFALTTFVLSLINLNTRDVTQPNIVLSLAFGYGGLVQLLAGMWEMAVGNTFGATALSSYGGFWISYAIVLTPGFDALAVYTDAADSASALGFFLTGWFIFTFILWLCTLRSTVMFSALFLTLDLAFLFLALGEFVASNGHAATALGLQKAGGVFGLLSAFVAWYNAFAGIADTSNSFFLIPVFHFPWSEKAREGRTKTERETV